MTVRMKDLAKDLGVSVMTVSKALRNHVDISVATQERVAKRARQLGYQPNWAARSLASGRTYMVGLVIPDLMHSYFVEVAKGVTKVLEPRGYHIVISNSETNAKAEVGQIKALLARNVDGLLIASVQEDGRWLFRTLRTHKTPCVMIDRMVRGLKADYVGVDSCKIGVLATEHLIEQGCRRIAHLHGGTVPAANQRLRGYRRALAKHGIKWRPQYVVDGGYQDITGYMGMQRLLRCKPLPDGVYCFNDPAAAGAIKAAFDAGLRVPNDVAIVGAGNVHYSEFLRVPLSSVDSNSFTMGETAAAQLVRRMEAHAPARPQRILVPLRLMARESSQRRNGLKGM